MSSSIKALKAAVAAKFGPVRPSRGTNGIELITTCPDCGKPKLSINARSGLYQCWRGCSSGHIRSLMKNVRLPDTRQESRVRPPIKGNVDIPGELIPLHELDIHHVAYSYLVGRKFDPVELSKTYGLTYCRQGKTYGNGLFNTTGTIIAPMYYQGDVVGWQARLLYNPDTVPEEDYGLMGFLRTEEGKWVKPPKYFTMPGMDKGRLFWNMDWARRSRVVVVCEGIFDSMAVGRCGVAAFGKGVSEQQESLLKSYWDLIVLLLDPDAGTQAVKLKESLETAVPTVLVTLDGYNDAGEAPQEEIWRQIHMRVEEAYKRGEVPKRLHEYDVLI